MQSYKRFWIPMLLLAAFVAIHCQGPYIWPSPPSLAGTYQGVYSRTVEGIDSGVIEPIIWSFTDKSFSFSCDWDHYPTKDRKTCFAGCSGDYSIGVGITLFASDSSSLDSNKTPRSCGGPYSPYGSYVLDQRKAGEVIMTSVTQNPQGMSVTRVIHIFK